MFSEDFQLEVGYLISEILLCFKQEDFRLTYLLYQSFAVVLNITLLKAVAVSALCIAVEFRESQAHVTSINVVTIIALVYRKHSATADTPEGSALVGLTIPCADEERESIVSLTHQRRTAGLACRGLYLRDLKFRLL